ncbi:MAG: low molecular weight phosphotyrosine protein phosphatase [Sphingobacteriia bacterium]|nr:low molecular weight phosphotyrosine protein phosphatase [Sphingobacteriia bacterium]NCC38271.1 low molecular weight phosphotyrosine protein phosphatase [Gammaproteobacteria bacterium]
MGQSQLPEATKVKVLFICMGNICRSPTAHGVFRKLVVEEGLAHRIEIDSAGTHGYHVGEAPDRRARQTALERGIDIGDLRARVAVPDDFHVFDHVLAMDRDNYRILSQLCPPERRAKLRLFMEFAPDLGIRDVPDPYYGGPEGFDRVYDLVEAAARGLLDELIQGMS